MNRHKIYAIFLAAIVLYAVVYFALISQLKFNWFRTEKQEELKLLEYEKSALMRINFRVFSSSERICKLQVCESMKDVRLKVGDNYFEENVSHCQKAYVSLDCLSASVHFNFNRSEANVSNYLEFDSLQFLPLPGKTLVIAKGNYSTAKSAYRLVDFLIDGKLVRSAQYLFSAGSHDLNINESFQLYPGKHALAVRLGNTLIEGEIDIPSDTPVAEYGLVLFAVILSVYLAKRNRLDVLNSFLLFFILTVFFLCVHFEISKNLGYTYLSYLCITLIAFIFCKLDLKLPKVEVKDAIVFAVFATAVCTTARIFIGSAILTSHYYLRHADLAYLHDNTNYFDELSYLGRPFTYPSQAFFMLTSAVSKLLFTQPSAIIFSMHTSFTFLFALVLYLTTRVLKKVERTLVSLAIFSNYLVLTLLLSSSLHTFAFLMLILSVYFYATNKHVSMLSLATGTAAHLTMLLAFPLFAYATDGFSKRIKHVAICMLGGGLIASIFYVPLIARHGMPYQILPGEKGYLQKYGLFGSFIDFNFFFPLIPLTIVFGFLDRRYRLPAIILLLALLFYMFVSYRMNIISIFALPFLVVYVFRNKIDFRPILLLPIASVFMVLLLYSGFTERCEYGAVNSNCIQPMQFVSMHTSSSETIVSNPIFGHLEAYYGQRKVLADVFVEYADEGKYLAAKAFAESLDEQKIAKYDISLALVEAEKNIEEFDKIYDNSLFKIYRLA